MNCFVVLRFEKTFFLIQFNKMDRKKMKKKIEKNKLEKNSFSLYSVNISFSSDQGKHILIIC